MDFHSPVHVNCSNCDKIMQVPGPLYINEWVGDHYRTFYFCCRKCFSRFIPIFTNGWRKSELE
jgi:hypothetical protein